MRILFDENVPLPLRQFFPNDSVSTVQEMGWAGISNGDLLNRAETQFDAIVLADKNMRYQQNLSQRRIAIVELPTNRWPILQGIASRITAAVGAAAPGSYTVVDP